jgi:hypothetical protein
MSETPPGQRRLGHRLIVVQPSKGLIVADKPTLEGCVRAHRLEDRRQPRTDGGRWIEAAGYQISQEVGHVGTTVPMRRMR